MAPEGPLRLPPWFDAFLELKADRLGLLLAALKAIGLEPASVELAGTRSIIVPPPSLDRRYRLKLLSAHYDRVSGTPGALDNSAACLQLFKLLAEGGERFNTLCVFTDREELSDGDATRQGSYALGLALSSLGYHRPLACTLDVCGRGDTLLLSGSARRLAGRTGVAQDAARDALSAQAELARLMAGRASVSRIDLPFGEDLGYMLSGIPAVAVGVLPSLEARALAREQSVPPWASLTEPGGRSPATWRVLHGAGDVPSLYTASAFALMERFLARFAAWKPRAWL